MYIKTFLLHPHDILIASSISFPFLFFCLLQKYGNFICKEYRKRTSSCEKIQNLIKAQYFFGEEKFETNMGGTAKSLTKEKRPNIMLTLFMLEQR